MLNAEVHDPEVRSTRRGERCLANGLVDAAATQIPNGADGPQSDVNGIPLVEKRPRPVRRTSSLTVGRTTGTTSLTTALLEQRELLRFRTAPASTGSGRRRSGSTDSHIDWIATLACADKDCADILCIQMSSINYKAVSPRVQPWQIVDRTSSCSIRIPAKIASRSRSP